MITQYSGSASATRLGSYEGLKEMKGNGHTSTTIITRLKDLSVIIMRKMKILDFQYPPYP